MKKPSLNTYRRAFQISVAVAFIIIPILNRTRDSLVYGNFLSFHMFGIPIADPLAVLQLTIKNFYLTVDNVIGTLLPLMLAFVLGTVFCSWICPYGLFSEWTQKLSRKLMPKSYKGIPITRNGFPCKLAIFIVGFFVFLIFSTTPILNQLSTAAWYSRFFQYLFGQDIVSWCFLFLFALLLIEFFAQKRLWCKYVCPQSILIILSKILNRKRLKVAFAEDKCICKPGHERCEAACHLTLNPKSVFHSIETECSNCGACVVACTKMGKALSFEFKLFERLQLGQKLKKFLPAPRTIIKTIALTALIAGLGSVIYYGVQNLELSDNRPEIKSKMLSNKKISWTNGRAEYLELLADGTLICVGGDWPVEGFKGWQWQPFGDNGSFKMIPDSEKPETYTIVKIEGKLAKSSKITLEQIPKDDSTVENIKEHVIELYEDLAPEKSHKGQATAMDSRVVLDRFAEEVYILALIVHDPGGKKIQKVFSEGDLITTEGMLTAVHRWINSPEIIASEGQPPKMPVHTQMILRYRGDAHTETINFVTDRTFDRTSEVYEDLWF